MYLDQEYIENMLYYSEHLPKIMLNFMTPCTSYYKKIIITNLSLLSFPLSPSFLVLLLPPSVCLFLSFLLKLLKKFLLLFDDLEFTRGERLRERERERVYSSHSYGTSAKQLLTM